MFVRRIPEQFPSVNELDGAPAWRGVDGARKMAPFLEPLFKRGMGDGIQERRCKGPLRQPERHKVKCRQQWMRVKVMLWYGLF
jgi:hypothetical protein